MADGGARRRNIGAQSSPLNSVRGPSSPTATSPSTTTTRSGSTKSTTSKVKAEEGAANEEDGLEPLPQLWKFSTWPSHVKLFPLYTIIMIVGVLAYNEYQRRSRIITGLDLSTFDQCVRTFNYGYRINAARYQARINAIQSWEIGFAAEAQLELQSPRLSVFGFDPFPDGKMPSQWGFRLDGTLSWATEKANALIGQTLFHQDKVTLAGPASLGVYALMASNFWGKVDFARAVKTQKALLLRTEDDRKFGKAMPRWKNGAISYLRETPAVYAEGVSMIPPFLAYYAVAKDDMEAMEESIRQVELSREALRTKSGKRKGLWMHTVGPSEIQDDGAWSSGNGWAAHGIARTRATVSKWKKSNETMAGKVLALDDHIAEILDAAIATDTDQLTSLLRNYLGDETSYGETTGTALLAATAYRMAVLNPSRFATPKYLDWAHSKRSAVTALVDDNGFAHPVVNPAFPRNREPFQNGTSVGSSALLMMGSAWRDCVCVGTCLPDIGTQMQSEV